MAAHSEESIVEIKLRALRGQTVTEIRKAMNIPGSTVGRFLDGYKGDPRRSAEAKKAFDDKMARTRKRAEELFAAEQAAGVGTSGSQRVMAAPPASGASKKDKGKSKDQDQDGDGGKKASAGGKAAKRSGASVSSAPYTKPVAGGATSTRGAKKVQQTLQPNSRGVILPPGIATPSSHVEPLPSPDAHLSPADDSLVARIQASIAEYDKAAATDDTLQPLKYISAPVAAPIPPSQSPPPVSSTSSPLLDITSTTSPVDPSLLALDLITPRDPVPSALSELPSSPLQEEPTTSSAPLPDLSTSTIPEPSPSALETSLPVPSFPSISTEDTQNPSLEIPCDPIGSNSLPSGAGATLAPAETASALLPEETVDDKSASRVELTEGEMSMDVVAAEAVGPPGEEALTIDAPIALETEDVVDTIAPASFEPVPELPTSPISESIPLFSTSSAILTEPTPTEAPAGSVQTALPIETLSTELAPPPASNSSAIIVDSTPAELPVVPAALVAPVETSVAELAPPPFSTSAIQIEPTPTEVIPSPAEPIPTMNIDSISAPLDPLVTKGMEVDDEPSSVDVTLITDVSRTEAESMGDVILAEDVASIVEETNEKHVEDVSQSEAESMGDVLLAEEDESKIAEQVEAEHEAESMGDVILSEA